MLGRSRGRRRDRRARRGGAVALMLGLAVLAGTSVLPGERDDSGGSPPAGDRIEGVVVEVIDGDTIEVAAAGRAPFTVRLLGIDTPESRRPGAPVECGGPEATASLAALALPGGRGREVLLTTDPTQDRVDRYGRLLAHARLRGGELLETAQLRAGWARTYVYRGRPVRRIAELRRQERAARAARRGVWGACGGDFHLPRAQR